MKKPKHLNNTTTSNLQNAKLVRLDVKDMLRYEGSFELLEQLGFITNQTKTYYFLHTCDIKDKYYNPITIDIKTREIEYCKTEELELIKSFVKRV